jgi:rRNA biogenesis protein RRP5
VWVAWLNLENSFGTPETLAKVFQEAQMYNEPKVVFLKLAEIYERSGKQEVTILKFSFLRYSASG